MESPLLELQRLGQSPWHDAIHRGLLTGGALARLVRDGDVTGLTSNPTIFEHAITTTSHYDDAIRALVAAGRKADTIVDTLVVEDIQQAADVFRPVFERTQRVDGYVSIEVAPALAHDTDGTIREAKRIWRAVNRPNVMVKIPATPAGLPAIVEAIALGINVNVTLIFSIARYRAVMDAYLTGLERRQEQGQRLDRLASVASFFVSRLDTAVDALLDQRAPLVPLERRGKLERLKGRTAIAQANVAYATFREVFASDRFQRLARDGARLQRPLWASTSTKNPAYPDVYYVDALVGADTVNTMPPATLAAYRHHGHPQPRLEQNLDLARKVLADVADFGVRLDEVTDRLEQEGVAAFAASWASLLDVVATRRDAVKLAVRTRTQVGTHEKAVQRALDTLALDGVARRLWSKDSTLWPGAAAAQLGWIDAAGAMAGELPGIRSFVDDLRRARITHVVLLGGSGGTVAASVLRRALGLAKGGLDVAVPDVGDPAALEAAWKRSAPERTCHLVAWSDDDGGVDAAFRVAWMRATAALDDRAREHFVAITPAGTPLERLAAERGFRRTFVEPADVGAHFGAMSLAAMVTAALLGHDAAKLLERADRMRIACGTAVPAAQNPAVHLGAVLGVLARAGRDKVTLVAPSRLAPFGEWLERLLASATGKQGRGIVPIVGEPLAAPAVYGDDRAFVHLRLGSAEDRAVTSLAKAGHPVVTIELADAADLAAEFVRWEIATAVACRVLEINPGDRSDARVALDAAARLLESTAPPAVPAPARVLTPAAPDFATKLASHLAAARGRRWVALEALATPTPKREAMVADIRVAIRKRFGVATTAGFGARAQQASLQLHAGGPAGVIVVQLASSPGRDLAVPERPWTIGTRATAVAVAELEMLAARRRPALRVELGTSIDAGLAAVLAALSKRPTAPASRAKAPGRTRPAARARAAGRR